MKFYVLKMYISMCKKNGTEPTWKGLTEFKKKENFALSK